MLPPFGLVVSMGQDTYLANNGVLLFFRLLEDMFVSSDYWFYFVVLALIP